MHHCRTTRGNPWYVSATYCRSLPVDPSGQSTVPSSPAWNRWPPFLVRDIALPNAWLIADESLVVCSSDAFLDSLRRCATTTPLTLTFYSAIEATESPAIAWIINAARRTRCAKVRCDLRGAAWDFASIRTGQGDDEGETLENETRRSRFAENESD